nr:unnamed protein product [Callosobruchus chinensis]
MIRLKRAVVIFGSLILMVVVLIIYSSKDLGGFPSRSSINQDFKDNNLLHFEDRLNKLEVELHQHHNAVHEIKEAMRSMIHPSSSTRSIKNFTVKSVTPGEVPLVSENVYDRSCPIQVNFSPRTDIQMLDLYKSIPFDNIDGGVWKQGWKIEINEKSWNRKNKLKVFVVPHSHNDPGWLKTVEDYYTSQTKQILDNMLKKLPEDPRRKFIWAEISYFSMWWEKLDEDDRKTVQKLLRSNQLEIVTGGWVMNDEANSHWLSISHQLTVGHQWLARHLNYTPTTHWSIDPFGLSSTQPLLLKEAGFRDGLIQRTHYSVKKKLAQERSLEFRWRQAWDNGGKTDLFTHMMPFYSYDIPHTCGPDPKVCCQFDFKRLPGHGLSCPWKIPPQPITENNVAQRAELLLDQYRKKSMLFKTNVLLAPLGDDFRYDHSTEWDVQYENYQKLFDYMNTNLNLNVQAQFGTLSDYFAAVHKEKKTSEFPVLSGDFFTYADRDDHYWSGYYTSRPFYKRMDRMLLSYIRAAEIIHTLAYLSKNPGYSWIVDKRTGLEKMIEGARQALALFQHHDGITGTAKDHVVVDYGKKMLSAINSCHRVIQLCAHVLLRGPGAPEANANSAYYSVDDVRHSHGDLPERHQITIGVPEVPSKKVVLYNSMTFHRKEAVTFHVSTPHLEVVDFHGKRIVCQVSPYFEYGSSMSQTKYLLTFVATVPALGLVEYTITAVYEYELPKETVFSKVIIYNHYSDVRAPRGFKPEVSVSSSEFTIQNSRVTASFNKLGLLKAIKLDKIAYPVHLDFAKYGARLQGYSERSGAYLFLPDGDAVPLQIENTVVNVIEGPVMSSVLVQLPYVQHSVTLYNSSGADSLGIEIHNTVDIAKTNNFELVMRLLTKIDSGDEFFTDLNGYGILRRKRFTKLPLQANYYPMPTMAFIEDSETRLTVVTGSPLGCSSLSSGQLEVMMDRRLNQDDNLGLGQGVLDNRPTRHVLRILVEKRQQQQCRTTADNHPSGFPTVSSHVSSQSLLNPLIRLLRVDDEDDTSSAFYAAAQDAVGVDMSMPSLRTGVYVKGAEHVGVTVHRQLLDLCFTQTDTLRDFPLSRGTINISSVIPMEPEKKLRRTSLTFMLVKKEVDGRANIPLCPMEVQAFIF